MVEFVDEMCQKIEKQYTNIFEGVIDLLQTLCSAVKEVGSWSISPCHSGRNLVLLMIIQLRYKHIDSHQKVQVFSKSLYLGTSKLTNMVQDIAYVEVDWSVLPMFLLHNIQQDTIEEIKAREHTVYDQLR